MDGAAVVGGDGKDGLGDHGVEDPLGQNQAVLILHNGKFRELPGVGAQDIELAHAAGDVDQVVLSGHGNHVVREPADDVPEEPGGENQTALLGDVGRHHSANAGFQVVASEAELFSGLQQQPFQGGDGALGGHGAGGDGNHGLENCFFTGELQGVPSFAVKW